MIGSIAFHLLIVGIVLTWLVAVILLLGLAWRSGERHVLVLAGCVFWPLMIAGVIVQDILAWLWRWVAGR